MSVTEFVISFIFMAVATLTILVVGTLGAADLLHRRHRSGEAEEGVDGSHLEDQSGDARARRDSRSEAAAERKVEGVDALVPLGSSISIVRHPKTRAAVDPDGDHEDPTPGRAA